jgi:catechol 2,3-dioxygenase-like lactoylglutathione lyase family enzyme
MLQGRYMHPTIPAIDLERARAWYEEKLGLTPSQEMPGGLIYQTSGEAWFLLFPTPNAGTAEHTVGGWQVEDIHAEVAELKGRGVVFEEYDFPTVKTVDSVAETGPVKAAWFKDSEGNILGIVQLPSE